MWHLLAHVAAAQPVTFQPEAQVRPRLEADTGRDGVTGAGTVGFVSMRTRLGATAERDDLSLRIVFQDVRSFGEELHPRRDDSGEGIDLRIGTVTWSPGAWQLEIGRMERGLHNERLLAIANWRQPGRSNDGARVFYQHDGWSMDTRALLVREGDSTDVSTTDQVSQTRSSDHAMVYWTAGHDDGHRSLYPIAIYDVDATDRRHRVTPGLYGTLTVGALHVEGEVYAQLGTWNDQDVSAAMLGVRATWQASDHASAGLGYDLLSGDSDPTDGMLRTFDTLQGANHRYYGNIDMAMFTLGGATDQQGLQDLVAQGRFRPVDPVELRLDLHAFFAAAPNADPFLAVEPDLSLHAQLTPGLGWSSGLNLWLPPTSSDAEAMAFTMLDARL